MSERLLPQNIEAEQCVLGSILIDPEAITEIDFLQAEDFYRDGHRMIYEIMLRLYQRREPADTMTVGDELARLQQVETIGGIDYLSRLTYVVPTSGNVAYYARIVARTAELRRLVHAAGQIAALAYERDEQALEKAETALFQIRRAKKVEVWTTMPVLMEAYLTELEYLHTHRGAVVGVPTGYDGLDLTLNGLQKSDLILLAARPSMGKTSLALCMAYNAALHGKKVAIFSLEMGKMALARRLMAMESKVDLQRLRSGWVKDDEWESIVAAINDLSALPIFINDIAGNPITSIRSQLRSLIREHGTIDMVVVDYLGLIEPDVEEMRRANLVQQISAVSRGLKGLAREFDLPVLALCQLSRAVESRQNKRPGLSDLRDSGSLEQDADVVLFLYSEDYYALREGREGYTPNHITDVVIAKHRNGPVGDVRLYYQPEQTMFYNLTREEGQAHP